MTTQANHKESMKIIHKSLKHKYRVETISWLID